MKKEQLSSFEYLFDNLKDRKNIFYYETTDFKDRLLNGKGKTYNENDNLSYECEFKDGIIKNGKLVYKGVFKHYKPNDKAKEYDENGNLVYEDDLKNLYVFIFIKVLNFFI